MVVEKFSKEKFQKALRTPPEHVEAKQEETNDEIEANDGEANDDEVLDDGTNVKTVEYVKNDQIITQINSIKGKEIKYYGNLYVTKKCALWTLGVPIEYGVRLQFVHDIGGTLITLTLEVRIYKLCVQKQV